MGDVVRFLSGRLDCPAFPHLFGLLRLSVDPPASSALLLSDGDTNVT
jgi:hypothetical protein